MARGKNFRLALFPKVQAPLLAQPRLDAGEDLPPPSPPPAGLPASRPPPPEAPYPWVWQCHACGAAYRLSCTRRCLNCGHHVCWSVTPSPAPKRRRRGGPCKAEFDYQGWAAWGRWRRQEAGANGEEKARNREARFASNEHDCFLYCDYPSECHYKRQETAAQGRVDPVSGGSAITGPVEEPSERGLEEGDEGQGRSPREDPAGLATVAAGSAADDFAQTARSLDDAMGSFYDDSDDGSDEDKAEDVDDDEGMQPASPQEQHRRSRQKLAQLTGHEPFLPIGQGHLPGSAVDTTPNHGEPLEPLAETAARQEVELGWWAQYQRSKKRRKCSA
jgi:hypothetical protein